MRAGDERWEKVKMQTMDQFSHDLTLALEETSRTGGVRAGRWGARRRTRSTGNLRKLKRLDVVLATDYLMGNHLLCSLCPATDRGFVQQPHGCRQRYSEQPEPGRLEQLDPERLR